MSDTKPLSKFILTVVVGEEQADEVEEVLSEAAEAMNGRLSRSDWEPAEAPGYHVKARSKTLRKQGVLA